ncbi:hypothetical protein [Streptosporangium sp. NPDC049644]|uniref:hypothetical protein n=1 Tax=Streptosporangium sp. NPDC049644 TaxID=3155507 RepID=UPI003447E377
MKPAADGLSTDTHGQAVSAEFIAKTDRDSAIGEAVAAPRFVPGVCSPAKRV